MNFISGNVRFIKNPTIINTIPPPVPPPTVLCKEGDRFPSTLFFKNTSTQSLTTFQLNDSNGNQYVVDESFVWAPGKFICVTFSNQPILPNGNFYIYAGYILEEIYYDFIIMNCIADSDGLIYFEYLLSTDPSTVSVYTSISTSPAITVVPEYNYNSIFELDSEQLGPYCDASGNDGTQKCFDTYEEDIILSGINASDFPTSFCLLNNTNSYVIKNSYSQPDDDSEYDPRTDIYYDQTEYTVNITYVYVSDSNGNVYYQSEIEEDPSGYIMNQDQLFFLPDSKTEGISTIDFSPGKAIILNNITITPGNYLEIYLEDDWQQGYSITIHNINNVMVITYNGDSYGIDPSTFIIMRPSTTVQQYKNSIVQTGLFGAVARRSSPVFYSINGLDRTQLKCDIYSSINNVCNIGGGALLSSCVTSVMFYDGTRYGYYITINNPFSVETNTSIFKWAATAIISGNDITTTDGTTTYLLSYQVITLSSTGINLDNYINSPNPKAYGSTTYQLYFPQYAPIGKDALFINGYTKNQSTVRNPYEISIPITVTGDQNYEAITTSPTTLKITPSLIITPDFFITSIIPDYNSTTGIIDGLISIKENLLITVNVQGSKNVTSPEPIIVTYGDSLDVRGSNVSVTPTSSTTSVVELKNLVYSVSNLQSNIYNCQTTFSYKMKQTVISNSESVTITTTVLPPTSCSITVTNVTQMSPSDTTATISFTGLLSLQTKVTADNKEITTKVSMIAVENRTNTVVPIITSETNNTAVLDWTKSVPTYSFTIYPIAYNLAGKYLGTPFVFTLCPAGTYCPSSNQSVLCPSGYYCPPNISDYTLYPCPAGTYCPIQSIKPLECPAGTYCPAKSGSTTVCPAGTYCPEKSERTTLCPPGTYTLLPGQTSSTACLSFSQPSEPTSVTATVVPGKTEATVTFTAPNNNNGYEITRYTITSLPEGRTTIITTPLTTSGTVSGLTYGTSYTFTVTATNAYGTSASSPSNAVTPNTVPDAPTNVTAVRGNAQATLSFTAPKSNGKEITGYTITSFPSLAIPIPMTTNISGIIITGLTNGTSYTFTVAAINQNGTGPASVRSSAIIPITVPGAPTNVTVIPGNSQVTVGFTAPANNGSTITSYTITSSFYGGGINSTTTLAGNVVSGIVTGLTNGTYYTFTVTATNAAGTGPVSIVSTPAQPSTVPTAPTIIAFLPTFTLGEATASFNYPVYNGGLALTGFTVAILSGGKQIRTVAVPPNKTSALITGLTKGIPYTFTVTATNANGTSPASKESSPIIPDVLPLQPQSVTAVAENAQATVSFYAPVKNEGTLITIYTITASPGGQIKRVTANLQPGFKMSGTVTGLTNGTSYTFTVTATNSGGTGVASGGTLPVTPRTVPGVPTAVTAIPGDKQATVSFTAPANNGGSVITGYTITSTVGGFTTSTTTTVGSIISGTITGLTNGTSYAFTVTARNAAGTSIASNPSSSVTPRTVPGVPTAVTATPGNKQAIVRFTAPVNNGGSVITGYTITSTVGGFTTSTTTTVGSIISGTITGLSNGTSYAFTVTARNAVGTSIPSNPSSSVIPCTVPDKPTAVTAIAGNKQATVSFTAPVDNGGSVITGYTITSTVGGFTTSTMTTVGSIISGTITGLSNDTSYAFTVTARNAAGSSIASNPSSSVIPNIVPDKPTSVTAIAGDKQATVSFTAPANNGGTQITGYTITSTIGGFTTSTTTTVGSIISGTITGLSNGTSYAFTVTARNAAGTSIPSNPSSSVIPCTVPDKPTAVTAIAGNKQATVSFTAPVDNGGSVITGYTITSTVGGFTTSTMTTVGSIISGTITGLSNGTSYAFTVTARNVAGTSVASNPSSSVIPNIVPDKPTAVTAIAGDKQATVSFTAPANNGGTQITGYTITSNPAVNPTTTTNTSGNVITGLTNGTAYTFTVIAKNSFGSGLSSAESLSVTPSTVPDSPTRVTLESTFSSLTVTFTAPLQNGGSPITSYTITDSSNHLLYQLTDLTTLSYTFTKDIIIGINYTINVIATNVRGNSSPSLPTSIVICPPPVVTVAQLITFHTTSSTIAHICTPVVLQDSINGILTIPFSISSSIISRVVIADYSSVISLNWSAITTFVEQQKTIPVSVLLLDQTATPIRLLANQDGNDARLLQDLSGVVSYASVSCTSGNHCPNPYVSIQCPLGNYCTGNGRTTPCLAGYYCPYSSVTGTLCPSGTYSGASSFDTSQCTVDNVTSLSLLQLQSITDHTVLSNILSSLTPAQFSYLTTTQIGSLTPVDISHISIDNISSLTPIQVPALPISVIPSLTKEQLQAIPLINMSEWTLSQLQQMSITQLQSFTSIQAGYFVVSQIRLIYSQLTYGQLFNLDPTVSFRFFPNGLCPAGNYCPLTNTYGNMVECSPGSYCHTNSISEQLCPTNYYCTTTRAYLQKCTLSELVANTVTAPSTMSFMIHDTFSNLTESLSTIQTYSRYISSITITDQLTPNTFTASLFVYPFDPSGTTVSSVITSNQVQTSSSYIYVWSFSSKTLTLTPIGDHSTVRISYSGTSSETATITCKIYYGNATQAREVTKSITFCQHGYYNLNGTCTLCPAGSYCQLGNSPVLCDSGSYSSSGATTCVICGSGTYSGMGATTCTNCSAGTICASGSFTEIICPPGKYCPDGVSELSCPSGYYCLSGTTGISPYVLVNSTTNNMKVGKPSFMTVGSSWTFKNLSYTSLYSIEFIIQSGSGNPTSTTTNGDTMVVGRNPTRLSNQYNMISYIINPSYVIKYNDSFTINWNLMPNTTILLSINNQVNTISIDQYGIFQTINETYPITSLNANITCNINNRYAIVCPSGTYCPIQSTSALPCTPGQYCPDGVNQLLCPSGTYCASGSSQPTQCLSGTYCLAGSSTETICPPGKYCPDVISQLDCPLGTYCASGSSQPTKCLPGTICASGSSTATICPPGKYCPDGVSELSCPSGYYCLSGTEVVTPYLLLNSTTNNMIPGKPSFMTIGSNWTFTNVNQNNLPNIPNSIFFTIQSGSGTPTASTSTGDRMNGPSEIQGIGYQSGYMINPNYSIEKGDSFTIHWNLVPNTEVLLVFDGPGYYNNHISINIDQYGKFKTITSPSFNNIRDKFVITCVNTSYANQCIPGTYCPSNSSVPITCPPGTYCPDGINELLCPSKSYCPSGSSQPIRCSPGFYCPSGSTTQSSVCPAGYYCPSGSSELLLCTIGSYCPSGSSIPLLCNQSGSYCPSGSTNTNTICLPGYYCPDPATEQLCPSGYYCPSGTSFIPYTLMNSTINNFSNGKQAFTTSDYSWTFTNISTNIFNPGELTFTIIDGDSNKPPLSTTSNGDSMVQSNNYYIINSTYSIRPGDYFIINWNLLPGSFYNAINIKLNNGLVPYFFSIGGINNDNTFIGDFGIGLQDLFSIIVTNTINSNAIQCPAGTYCPTGSLNPLPCPSGSYCESGSSTITKCPLGSYCPDSAHKRQCKEGFYCPTTQTELICPQGMYCPPGSTFPTICPSGTFCPAGTMSYTPYLLLSTSVNNMIYGTFSFMTKGCSWKFTNTSSTVFLPGMLNIRISDPYHIYDPISANPKGYTSKGDILQGGFINVSHPIGQYDSFTIYWNITPSVNGNLITLASSSTPYNYYGMIDYAQFNIDSNGLFTTTSVTKIKDVFTITSQSSTDVQLCTPGTYCPIGSFVPINCPPGSYCPDGNNVTICPIGNYCPNGAIAPIVCPDGTFCLSGSSSPEICPSGSYCPTPMTEQPCPSGYTCSSGTSLLTPYVLLNKSMNINHLVTGLPSFLLEGSSWTFTNISTGSIEQSTILFQIFGNGTPTSTTSNGDSMIQSNDQYIINPTRPIKPGDSFTINWNLTLGSYIHFQYNQMAIYMDYNAMFQIYQDDIKDTIINTYIITCEDHNYAKKCKPGTYCPSSSIDPIICPDGSYCPDGINIYECPSGYSCPYGSSNPDICLSQNNKYSLSGSSSCSICRSTTYYDTNTLTCTTCPAGSYCPYGFPMTICSSGTICLSGAVTPTICPPGFYCPDGTTINKCDIGYYGCNEGTGSTGQTICPPGFYCPDGVTINQCVSGYYGCDLSGTVIQIDCPTGYVCPDGIDRYTCISGYYGCSTTTNLSSSQTICSSGFYCPDGINEFICPPGFVCPRGSSTPLSCDLGMYCPSGSYETTICPPGFYCPSSKSISVCPSGSYCSTGSTIPLLCDEGTYCPSGSYEPIPCPVGKYCPSGSSSDILVCPAGSYCLNGVHSTICPSGSYCLAGTTILSPHILLNSTTNNLSNGNPSFMTDGGTWTFTNISSQTFIPGTLRIKVVIGSFDTKGSTSNGDNLVQNADGYTINPTYPLKPGDSFVIYWNKLSNVTTTYVEISASYTSYGSSYITKNMQYVVDDNDTFNQPSLYLQYFTPISEMMTMFNITAVNNKNVQPCPNGTYCPQGSSSPNLCPAGSYCTSSSTSILCPSGSYCPIGSIHPNPCATDSYCPLGSPEDLPCPAGYYCTNNTVNKICPIGYYCPSRSIEPISCPTGSLCNSIGSSTFTLCNAGSFCPSGDIVQTCPSGYSCPSGSKAPILCPYNSYSKSGSSSCSICTSGTYSDYGASYCNACPSGTICTTVPFTVSYPTSNIPYFVISNPFGYTITSYTYPNGFIDYSNGLFTIPSHMLSNTYPIVITYNSGLTYTISLQVTTYDSSTPGLSKIDNLPNLYYAMVSGAAGSSNGNSRGGSGGTINALVTDLPLVDVLIATSSGGQGGYAGNGGYYTALVTDDKKTPLVIGGGGGGGSSGSAGEATYIGGSSTLQYGNNGMGINGGGNGATSTTGGDGSNSNGGKGGMNIAGTNGTTGQGGGVGLDGVGGKSISYTTFNYGVGYGGGGGAGLFGGGGGGGSQSNEYPYSVGAGGGAAGGGGGGGASFNSGGAGSSYIIM